MENAIGRVRALAENLVHNFERPSFGLGLRATRHATWLLNPDDPIRGATGLQLFHNKVYKGKLCEFGEPVVFGYFRGPHKRRRQGVVFLGKPEPQSSYIMVTAWPFQEVRRAGTNWKTHLSFSLNFNFFSSDYKSGFGGRIISTKARPGALALGAQPHTKAGQSSALLGKLKPLSRAYEKESPDEGGMRPPQFQRKNILATGELVSARCRSRKPSTSEQFRYFQPCSFKLTHP